MDTPTMQEVVGGALDARAAEIRTAMPARVASYNLTTQTADVQPTVWRQGEESPIVPSVPVIWPRGGDSYLAMELTSADSGLLICCETDLAEWRRTGESGAPADEASHHLQNAVFLPGLSPSTRTLSQTAGAAVLAGNSVLLGDVLATNAAVHEALLPDLSILCSSLSTWAGNVQAIIGAVAGTATLVAACGDVVTGVAVGSYKSSSVKVET